MRYIPFIVGAALVAVVLFFASSSESQTRGLSKYKLPTKLSQIPTDPKNPLSPVKVELGRQLFHADGLAFNPKTDSGKLGKYSCATCHLSVKGFTAGQRQGLADGAIGHLCRVPMPGEDDSLVDAQPVRTPTAINIAYAQGTLTDASLGNTAMNLAVPPDLWEFPRSLNMLGLEGTETQAIAGLTAHRMGFCEQTLSDPESDDNWCTPLNIALFDATFSSDNLSSGFTDMHKAGLAIAAYERSLIPHEAPFQRYLRGDTDAMSKLMRTGMNVFFSKRAGCVRCHNDPALGGSEVVSVGLGDLEGEGILSRHTEGAMRGRGGFTKDPKDEDTYRVPQLYNLKDMVPLGHGGTLESVEEAIEYFAKGKIENPSAKNIDRRHNNRHLSKSQMRALTAFVKYGLYDAEMRDR